MRRRIVVVSAGVALLGACHDESVAPPLPTVPTRSGGADVTEDAHVPSDGRRTRVCIRRQRELPVDQAGGLASKPLPVGLYSIQIDDAARVDVSPPRGTALEVEPTRGHRAVLFRES